MNETTLWIVVVSAALLSGSLLGFLAAHLRAGRLEGRLRSEFEALAGRTLRDNSEMFLRLARETLGRDQVVAQASLKERETAIAQLVAPLRAALDKTDAQAQSLERERRDAYTTLRTQIQTLSEGQASLQRETRNLVTAFAARRYAEGGANSRCADLLSSQGCLSTATSRSNAMLRATTGRYARISSSTCPMSATWL